MVATAIISAVLLAGHQATILPEKAFITSAFPRCLIATALFMAVIRTFLLGTV